MFLRKFQKSRPVVAVDLDGVIAVERGDLYLRHKKEGTLKQYFQGLSPNWPFLGEMKKMSAYFDLHIVTARRVEQRLWIRKVTHDWLDDYYVTGLVKGVVLASGQWKAREVFKLGASALVDNNPRMLRAVPFVTRVEYHVDHEASQWYGEVSPWLRLLMPSHFVVGDPKLVTTILIERLIVNGRR